MKDKYTDLQSEEIDGAKKLYLVVGAYQRKGMPAEPEYVTEVFDKSNLNPVDNYQIKSTVGQYKELAVGSHPINRIILYYFNPYVSQFEEVTHWGYEIDDNVNNSFE